MNSGLVPLYGVDQNSLRQWVKQVVTKRVLSRAESTVSPDRIWQKVGDFCATWHPAIDSMTAERDETGALVRAFTVQGEGKIYRERLTYYSATERTFVYSHVEGIEGVNRYDAKLQVLPRGIGGSLIEMSADLEADQPRADEIAKGTKEIFDLGTAIIAGLSGDAENGSLPTVQSIPSTKIFSRTVDGSPELATSFVDREGEALALFLHGIGGNRGNWDGQLEAVALFCPAASLDLRGYGDSGTTDRQSSIEDYCEDILRVKNAFGAKRLILCGLSYGSWIATSFAMRHADLLAGLVLSGGCTGMSEAGLEEREAFKTSRLDPIEKGQTPADFAPGVVELISGPNASEGIRSELLRSMAQISSHTYRDSLICFTSPQERFDFSHFNLPVLLMTGEHDLLASPTEIKHVANRISEASSYPNVRFEVLNDAGHVCNLERPDLYNSFLTDFVRQITG